MSDDSDETDNVIQLTQATSQHIPVERVLDAAKERLNETCLVLGWDEDDLLYVASSTSNAPELLWMIEKAKQALLEIGE